MRLFVVALAHRVLPWSAAVLPSRRKRDPRASGDRPARRPSTSSMWSKSYWGPEGSGSGKS